MCGKEAHEGITCTERELLDDPAEQERLNEQWALTAGVKRCPSCRVFVQKTEGCNHMTCHCGVHFCWICSKEFDSNSIYRHMSMEHGGIDTPDIPQPIRANQQLLAQPIRANQLLPQPIRANQLLPANQQIRATLPVRADEQIRADFEYAQRLQRQENLRGRRADLGNVGLLQQAIDREEQVRDARRIQAMRDVEEAIEMRRAEERRVAEAQQRAREERGSWCIIM